VKLKPSSAIAGGAGEPDRNGEPPPARRRRRPDRTILWQSGWRHVPHPVQHKANEYFCAPGERHHRDERRNRWDLL